MPPEKEDTVRKVYLDFLEKVEANPVRAQKILAKYPDLETESERSQLYLSWLFHHSRFLLGDRSTTTVKPDYNKARELGDSYRF